MAHEQQVLLRLLDKENECQVYVLNIAIYNLS